MCCLGYFVTGSEEDEDMCTQTVDRSDRAGFKLCTHIPFLIGFGPVIHKNPQNCPG